MLALVQVSVINALKGTKEHRDERLLSGGRSNESKDNKAIVKTPSPASTGRISLNHSTSRSTGTKGRMMLTSSDPGDFSQVKVRFCQPPKPLNPIVSTWRSSHRGSVETNPTRNHEGAVSIPGLDQWG